jgi:hypothetical protein
MATVYIKPGSGSGSGTLADPYYYSELSTAETAAGADGTILFTDGEYDNSITFDSLQRKLWVMHNLLGPMHGLLKISSFIILALDST